MGPHPLCHPGWSFGDVGPVVAGIAYCTVPAVGVILVLVRILATDKPRTVGMSSREGPRGLAKLLRRSRA